MKDIVNIFKAIMSDKNDRVEFIGSIACVLMMLVACCIAYVIFQSEGLLK